MNSALEQKLTGIPFRWGGTTLAEGLDCFGYASYVRGVLGNSFLDRNAKGLEQLSGEIDPAELPKDLPWVLAQKLLDPRPADDTIFELDLVVLKSPLGVYSLSTVVESHYGTPVRLAITTEGQGSRVLTLAAALRHGSKFMGAFNPAPLVKSKQCKLLTKTS